jgi:hypothetical protein
MITISARLSAIGGHTPLWTSEVHRFAPGDRTLVARCGVDADPATVEVVRHPNVAEQCRICLLAGPVGLAVTA